MVGADATALVAMSLARQLGLVKRLVGKVTVGDITGREITATVRALDRNCELPDEELLEVRYLDIAAATLSLSESETVHLARQDDARLVLTDDVVVRQELSSFGVPTMGTIGILYAGHDRGMIEDLPKTLDRLSRFGYGLNRQCERILLGETEQ